MGNKGLDGQFCMKGWTILHEWTISIMDNSGMDYKIVPFDGELSLFIVCFCVALKSCCCPRCPRCAAIVIIVTCNYSQLTDVGFLQMRFCKTPGERSSPTSMAKRRKPSVSTPQEICQAWVGACEAGDLPMVELLLPLVERLQGGVNCCDSLGVTGLLAALGSGQLEVVERLLELSDIEDDFKKEDKLGRSALDYIITSNSAHYLERVLYELLDGVGRVELNRMLLPRFRSAYSPLDFQFYL